MPDKEANQRGFCEEMPDLTVGMMPVCTKGMHHWGDFRKTLR